MTPLTTQAATRSSAPPPADSCSVALRAATSRLLTSSATLRSPVSGRSVDAAPVLPKAMAVDPAAWGRRDDRGRRADCAIDAFIFYKNKIVSTIPGEIGNIYKRT